MNTATVLKKASKSTKDKAQIQTHETFLIGMDKHSNIIFLKSYHYPTQKKIAQLEAGWVAKNCAAWHFGAMHEFKVSHVEHGKIVSEHSIIIPHP